MWRSTVLSQDRIQWKCFLHSGLEQSGTWSDVVAQAALPSPLRSECRENNRVTPATKFKVCGKSYGCSQALGGQQTLHRPIGAISGRVKGDLKVVVHRLAHQNSEASSLSWAVDWTQKILTWRNNVLHIITYDFLIYPGYTGNLGSGKKHSKDFLR